MRRFAILALLFAAGCGASEPSPEPAPAAPGPGAAGAPSDEVRGQIALKKDELRREDINLGNIVAERLQLDAQPASEAKTNRLAELARLEADCRARRQALEAEVAALERQASAGGTARPASADEALDLALAAEAQRKREEEEKRRLKAAAEASSEKKRLEEAEKALAAERAAREREKIQSAPGAAAPAGEDRPLFEERYAAQILKLKMELQKFKRW